MCGGPGQVRQGAGEEAQACSRGLRRSMDPSRTLGWNRSGPALRPSPEPARPSSRVCWPAGRGGLPRMCSCTCPCQPQRAGWNGLWDCCWIARRFLRRLMSLGIAGKQPGESGALPQEAMTPNTALNLLVPWTDRRAPAGRVAGADSNQFRGGGHVTNCQGIPLMQSCAAALFRTAATRLSAVSPTLTLLPGQKMSRYYAKTGSDRRNSTASGAFRSYVVLARLLVTLL